jgi:hypothetical protein
VYLRFLCLKLELLKVHSNEVAQFAYHFTGDNTDNTDKNVKELGVFIDHVL